MKHLLSRILYAALISTLAIGSVSPMSTAQAAPPAERVNFSMKVQNPKTTLRCGQTVTYLVKVELAQSKGAPTPAPGSLGLPKGQSVIGVKVEGSSVDKNVGDFVGTEKGYATGNTAMVFDDDLVGLGARFKFKAKKAGTTTLYFEGLVGKEYVSDKVDVKVLPCRYKVKTVIHGQTDPPFTGITDDSVMTSDEAGAFTGSATMTWVYADKIFSGGCITSSSAPASHVDLTGQLDDDGGQFVATVDINQTTVSATNRCPWLGVTNTFTFPIVFVFRFNVPSSGGVSTQTSGPALGNIVVIPEEDEAVAFNTKGWTALSSPAWWTMLWDEFPSLFGALLALH